MKTSLTKLELRLYRYLGRGDIVRCLDVIDAIVASRDRAAVGILKHLLNDDPEIAEAANLGLVSLRNERPRLGYWKRHRPSANGRGPDQGVLDQGCRHQLAHVGTSECSQSLF
jgi:hypothetical protein